MSGGRVGPGREETTAMRTMENPTKAACGPAGRRARAAWLIVLALLPGAASAQPARVDHGAAPAAQGLVVGELRELWRAGGADDEAIFGSVAAAQVDGQGDVLLLDGQLAVVHVFSPAGELLRTVCREGDGPGEVRRPNDMVVRPDGTIAVVQGFPGRLVMLHSDGTPAAEASYTTGQEGEGQFTVLVRAWSAGPDLVLAGIRMSFAGSSRSGQTYFLDRCDAQGRRRHALLEKEHAIDYADFELTEAGMDFVWSRAAVAPDGTAFVAADRDRYAIAVHRPAGGSDPDLVIARAADPAPRTERQRQAARQVLQGVGANYPVPPKRIVIEETPPVIEGMWADAGGRLWVQTSAGNRDAPQGCWTVLDVFGPDGAFQSQVALPGGHSPERDALFVLGDGRILVVVGALDAFLSQQGVGETAGAADEAEPLEVICSELLP